MMSRIPETLRPFVLAPSKHALHLISYVLGSSANWLILRHVYAFLSSASEARPAELSKHARDGVTTAENASDEGPVAVVLISWLREYEYWKTEARRAVGLNLDQLKEKGHFAFVDGLSSSFDLCKSSATSTKDQTHRSRLPSPPLGIPSIVVHSAQDTTSPQAMLYPPSLSRVKEQILNTINDVQQRNFGARIVVILDTPTLLIETVPECTSNSLQKLILSLRSAAYSTIVACQADAPFVSPAAAASDAIYHGHNDSATSATSPLEVENAAFVMGCVSQTSKVLSCRRLGTGWAEDVSGVLRVTRGGAHEDETRAAYQSEVDEGEWLYHVKGDGSVKVWGRGDARE